MPIVTGLPSTRRIPATTRCETPDLSSRTTTRGRGRHRDQAQPGHRHGAGAHARSLPRLKIDGRTDAKTTETGPAQLVEGRSPGRDSGGRKVPESPKFIRQAPDAPDWLDAEALAEWRRVAPTLERLDLLKPEDRALLSAYCETWSVYVAAVQRVRAEGLTITSPKSGVVHRNPAVTVAETARMHLLRLASEFGLTPAAEQRLAVAPGDDGDGLNPFAPDR